MANKTPISDFDLLEKNLTLKDGSNSHVYKPPKYFIKGLNYHKANKLNFIYRKQPRVEFCPAQEAPDPLINRQELKSSKAVGILERMGYIGSKKVVARKPSSKRLKINANHLLSHMSKVINMK